MTTISHKRISETSIGGGGYGNTYRFEVNANGMTLLSTCERDVAEHYRRAGLPVPAELAGPYDCYGLKAEGRVWSYRELPKGWYRASVERDGNRWLFRAIPNMGGNCTEGRFDTEALALEAAQHWIDGTKTAAELGMYSAAF